MKEGNAEKVEELYRSCYRQAWNVETVRNILSRVSNLMILSEYDVRESMLISNFLTIRLWIDYFKEGI